MQYFNETDKLLADYSFLKFAKSVYTTFVEADDQFQIHSELRTSYDVTIDEWMHYCVPAEPTNKSIFIKDLAIKRATKLIINDWDNFDVKLKLIDKKNHKNAIAEFLQEAKKVRTLIAQKDYLTPIQTNINEQLDRIVNHYKAAVISREKSKSMANDEDEIQPLKWNAGPAMLIELFRDLLEERTSENKPYISRPALPQLVKFINRNFIDGNDNPIDEGTLKKYLYDKDKKVAKKITLTFPNK